ncbi:protein eyes shut homolog isoform X4 [Narcine bancroftii]|uniref:protein eyes shut homolog isoform X4 n=1 Tax=Narcine bancroftii TaxID=1343680 RepID=UPI003831AAF8
MIVDFHCPLHINGSVVERVRNTKFLGVHLKDNLSWIHNTSSLVRKAQHHLQFLRLAEESEATRHHPNNVFQEHIRECPNWLHHVVDNRRNKTCTSPGTLMGLNVFSQFYVGGYSEYTPELLPNGTHFSDGFRGCIYELVVRTDKDRKFRMPGIPVGRPNVGRNVGQCRVSLCDQMKCRNGGTCVDKASTTYCQCAPGWKGVFCTETINVCDPEHKPPHQCAPGSLCITLPEGYTCRCPLGTTGILCDKALAISDPSFRSNESSWMAFSPFNIRHKTHIKLQFLPRSPDGILFYTAQRLGTRSGDFLSIGLAHSFVQLRYNLGDATVVIQSTRKVDLTGKTWQFIEAGRTGNQGYLALNRSNMTRSSSAGMTSLDAKTPIFVGGVPHLNEINAMAVEHEPVGFDGCVREVVVNDFELKLTEKGAKDGSNVGDCDGTACGYKTCENKGICSLNSVCFLEKKIGDEERQLQVELKDNFRFATSRRKLEKH